MNEASEPTPKKRKPGKPPKPVLDAVELAAALAANRGNVHACARQMGVERSSLLQFIRARPTLLRVLEDAREGMLDSAESALYRAVEEGQAWAVCFFLKTQGRSRGYMEMTEINRKVASWRNWSARLRANNLTRADDPQREEEPCAG